MVHDFTMGRRGGSLFNAHLRNGVELLVISKGGYIQSSQSDLRDGFIAGRAAWATNGAIISASREDWSSDIVKTLDLTTEQIKVRGTHTVEIETKMLDRAKKAGLKAEPDYDKFVKAIAESLIQSSVERAMQPLIEVISTVLHPPTVVNGTQSVDLSHMDDRALEWLEQAIKNKRAAMRLCVDANGVPQNESETRSSCFLKTEVQSDLGAPEADSERAQ